MSRRLAGPAAFAVALLGPAVPQAASAQARGFSLTPSKTEPYAACGRPSPAHAECLAILVPATPTQSSSGALQPAVSPSLSGSGVGGGYSPADLRSAYNLPSASAGSGQTVAIVDAFDDPNAESDLATYRSRYGLSACTSANGCFRKVNQSGGTTPYPKANAGWAVEISLDLDMASAACPNCHILLVEATSNSDSNLFAAEDEAVALGATEISNSWAGEEFSEETSADSHFNHPGVPITVSAGDSGYKVEYPAASPYVIAVGGTRLSQASNSRGWSETAWSGTGSGCSAYEPKPVWQSDSGCTKRTNVDVAAVASPETPVSVADSYKLPSEFSKPEPGWTLVGGTSASSPLIAGTIALANAYTRSFGADALYKEATQNGTGVLDDVVSGSNGSCGNYLCNAGPGYDGPTGLGSPYGAPVVLPNPPTVVTKPASSIAQTTATLNATVNPNSGEVTDCKFEYGTTTAYGSTASCASLPGSGSSPVAVSAAIATLTANTTYHFRISATNAGGTSKGADETLQTLPGAPTVETKPASSVTQTTATLNATVNPNGGNVTTCEFEYGTTNAYGSTASCASLPGSGTSPVAVSAAVTGLTPNTTYHFRISATNAGGTSKGADETLKTLPGAPTVVTGSASTQGSHSATLNATVSPGNWEVGECKFEYGTTTAYGKTAPCTPPPGSGSGAVAVSAWVSGLTTSTTYHFRISATNAGGTSKGSDQVFATPAAANEPHYFSGGLGAAARIGPEERVPVVSWGTLSLTNLTAGGSVTCRVVIGGFIENPAPGGATGPPGVGSTSSFNPYECESAACTSPSPPLGAATYVSVFAETVGTPIPNTGSATNLGWPSHLLTEGATIRSESERIKVNVRCHVQTATNEEGEPVFGTVTAEPSEGSDKPSLVTKCCKASAPPEIEFDAGSGTLHHPAPQEAERAKTEGILKILGYDEQEVINARMG